MAEPLEHRSGLPWHRALVYAVTGRRHDLADPPRPDVQHVARWLRSEVGVATLSAQVQGLRAREEPWPYPVPDDLMTGLGYAQFSAALTQLLDTLDLDATGAVAPQVSAQPDRGQQPSAAVRRLLDDVPPHHGT